jgi:hypothetical protein
MAAIARFGRFPASLAQSCAKRARQLRTRRGKPRILMLDPALSSKPDLRFKRGHAGSIILLLPDRAASEATRSHSLRYRGLIARASRSMSARLVYRSAACQLSAAAQ